MNTDICLCYTPGKGLFVRNCSNSSDSIFTAYNTKGYRSTKVELPLDHITIRIESNFHYGRRSYLYACIERNNTQLLDFSLEQIQILNHSSVKRFSVLPEDWMGLFTKIITAYNCNDRTQYHIEAIRYINELGKVINSDSIEIKSVFHDKETVKWDDISSLTLLIADKLRDLLDGIKVGRIKDDILTEKILGVCRIYIKNLMRIELNPEDSRTIRFAKTLTDICIFMAEHNAELDFLMNFRQW